MKAFRVRVEGCECIAFEVSALWARCLAAKEFKKSYRCPTYPMTECEETPYLDHYFDETMVDKVWDEKSLGECSSTEAFGGGF